MLLKLNNIGFLGAYVPLTINGNILVDWVLVSCYPSMNHDLSHFGTTPIRWFPEIIEWIFGDDNGWQSYVKIAEEIGRIIPYWYIQLIKHQTYIKITFLSFL